jgi:hypothetical protein
MRTYGRTWDVLSGVPTWVVVETDANGFNDYVWATTLCQCLQLNINESPFYSTWGIPAQPSVVQNVFPDFYVSLMQQRFAPHFAALIIAKLPTPAGSPFPLYQVNITTNFGAKIQQPVGQSVPPNANPPAP